MPAYTGFDYSKYKTIALFKIVEVVERYKPEDTTRRYNAYKIRVKTLEHYKVG